MRSLVLLALALAAGTAAAQRPIDTDGDGAISLEEYETARLRQIRERFAALDTDGDGKLTEQEIAAGRSHGGRGPMMGGAIDTDGDGAWSFAELQARRPEITAEQFNRLDKNGDGLITADERPMRPARGMPRRGR